MPPSDAPPPHRSQGNRRQNKALIRYLREEIYALSSHYRSALDRGELDIRRFRGLRDLNRLPLTSRADLATSDESWILKPSPHAIRAYWGFWRKLALTLGGQRARGALMRGYEPLGDLPPDSPLARAACTQHDWDVLGQAGLWAAQHLPLTGQDSLICALPASEAHERSLSHALLERVGASAQEGGLAIHCTHLPDDAPPALLAALTPNSTLLASSATITQACQLAQQTSQDLKALKTLVVVGPSLPNPQEAILWARLAPHAQVARLLVLTDAPMISVEDARPMGTFAQSPDQGLGFIVPAELCILEVVHPTTHEPMPPGQPGEILYTSLAAHGRPLLRLATGVLTKQGLRTHTPPGCPPQTRLSSQLQHP